MKVTLLEEESCGDGRGCSRGLVACGSWGLSRPIRARSTRRNVCSIPLLGGSGPFGQRDPFIRAGNVTLAAPAAASLRKWISPCYVIHYYGNIRYLALLFFLQQIYRKTHADRRSDWGRFEALALKWFGFPKRVFWMEQCVVGGASTCVFCSSLWSLVAQPGSISESSSPNGRKQLFWCKKLGCAAASAAERTASVAGFCRSSTPDSTNLLMRF